MLSAEERLDETRASLMGRNTSWEMTDNMRPTETNRLKKDSQIFPLPAETHRATTEGNYCNWGRSREQHQRTVGMLFIWEGGCKRYLANEIQNPAPSPLFLITQCLFLIYCDHRGKLIFYKMEKRKPAISAQAVLRELIRPLQKIMIIIKNCSNISWERRTYKKYKWWRASSLL